MSERIVANNLDEVINKNAAIRDEMIEKALLIRTKWNRMQISSSSQLAMQILKGYGLIQIPLDNQYFSGAIFVKNDKKIPVINTALSRVNQYFTAWHEIYHLIYSTVSSTYIIETETIMEERKAEYFAALMLFGNLLPYYTELSEMDFLSKIFNCIATFNAPYKAILISLYESAIQIENTSLMSLIKENFDNSFSDLPDRFRKLGLDDSLVEPSYVINVGTLQSKIQERIKFDPELKYNHENQNFLRNIVEEINLITSDNT
jgi:hypothetical protein